MPEKLDYLLPILEQVESNGQANKIGDKGRAAGILQQHEAYRECVNRAYGTNYTRRDSLHPGRAREISFFYLSYWASVYKTKTGKDASLEVLARIHNGGPTGYAVRATKKYWRKVLSYAKS